MTKTGIIGTVFLAAFLVASSIPATADDPTESNMAVIDTWLSVSTNPFLGEGSLWGGDQTFGYVDVDLCWEPGGLNPLEEAWTLELIRGDDDMDWMELTLTDTEGEVEPALYGSSAEAECGDSFRFELVLRATGDILHDHTHTFTFDVVVHGEDTIGTYSKPGNEDASLSITTDEEEEDLFATGNDDENGDNNNEPGPVEESPAPALMVVGLLTVGLLALVRRRA